MYSGDIDSLISGLDSTIEACTTALTALAAATEYQLECPGLETPKPYSMDWGSISSAISGMSTGLGNAKSVGDTIYSGAGGFNTSSGSPWTELQRFQSLASSAASGPSTLNYVGEKASALAKLNMIISLAVDAKHAVIYYHDILTRGIDSIAHNNEPSITWDKSVKGTKTMGNIENSTTHNGVHIPPESLDPY